MICDKGEIQYTEGEKGLLSNRCWVNWTATSFHTHKSILGERKSKFWHGKTNKKILKRITEYLCDLAIGTDCIYSEQKHTEIFAVHKYLHLTKNQYSDYIEHSY